MKPRFLWLNIMSWLAPVVAVLIAVGLDRWERALREEASASFNFAAAAWGALAADLVVAGLLLVLAWLIALRSGHLRGPAALCLAIGVLLAVYPWLFILAGQEIPRAFMWPPLRDLHAALAEGGLGSRASLFSSFFVLAGLVGLVSPRRQTDVTLKAQMG